MPESRSQRRARVRNHPSEGGGSTTPWGQILGVIAALGGTLTVYIIFNASLSVNEPIRNVIADVTASLLRLSGSHVTNEGSLLRTGDLQFAIVTNCTPAGPLLLLWGGMLAFPGTLRSKLTGMAVGAVVLISLNFVRLVTLIIIGVEWNSALDVAHLLVWQSVMILASVANWLTWLRGSSRTVAA
ncbi:MAG: hypothetical protein FI703_02540 [SAR202 cluster bacterium]|nr:hypothetical protein [SAR202 cluster bacterium]